MGEDFLMLVNGAHSFGGRQIKILHSLKFDPGAEPSSQGLQINSCSIHLVDIKKEKPFFNSEVQLQAQARTDYNQVSDIIGKADRKNVEMGSREPGRRLGHQGPASQSRWPWAEEGRAGNQHSAVSLAEEVPQGPEKYQKMVGYKY